MKQSQEPKIPDYLPLLEGLCWNIDNPYSLSSSQMLSIYEERWHFVDVLAQASPEEIKFIEQIILLYEGLPLMAENEIKRDDFFDCIKIMLKRLNVELLERHRIYLAGGSLIGLKHGASRFSGDLDFLTQPKDYQQIKLAINNGARILLDSPDLTVGEPRIDRYGIRYPVTIEQNGQLLRLKLEIVAEYNLVIGVKDYYHNIPCLNFEDRVVSKLIANADRWCDHNKFSRDLIDLAMIAEQQKLPYAALCRANNVYPDAERCLIEAIKQFQNLPEYRQKCYCALQVSEPSRIINGIDQLASSYSLATTVRSFGETDFGYL